MRLMIWKKTVHKICDEAAVHIVQSEVKCANPPQRNIMHEEQKEKEAFK